MIRIEILSGKLAGTTWVARRFPVRLGRSADADFQSSEPGVWEQHAAIETDRREGCVLKAQADAAVLLDGKPIQFAPLRNGDVIELGSLKLRFWLGEAQQKALTAREAVVWAILAGVVLLEAGLMFWLRRSS
jgi:predicted component of type VI protein secretion system